MTQVKSVAEWMTERGLTLAQLVEASALDRRVVFKVRDCPAS